MVFLLSHSVFSAVCCAVLCIFHYQKPVAISSRENCASTLGPVHTTRWIISGIFALGKAKPVIVWCNDLSLLVRLQYELTISCAVQLLFRSTCDIPTIVFTSQQVGISFRAKEENCTQKICRKINKLRKDYHKNIVRSTYKNLHFLCSLFLCATQTSKVEMCMCSQYIENCYYF